MPSADHAPRERVLRGGKDAHVPGTPADVALQVPGHASGPASGHSWQSATVAITKPGVQNPRWREPCAKNASCTGCSAPGRPGPSDRGHRPAIDFSGEACAGARCTAVDEQRSGAADLEVAGQLGARQAESLAQEVDQEKVVLDLDRTLLAVQRQLYARAAAEPIDSGPRALTRPSTSLRRRTA